MDKEEQLAELVRIYDLPEPRLGFFGRMFLRVPIERTFEEKLVQKHADHIYLEPALKSELFQTSAGHVSPIGFQMFRKGLIYISIRDDQGAVLGYDIEKATTTGFTNLTLKDLEDQSEGLAEYYAKEYNVPAYVPLQPLSNRVRIYRPESGTIAFPDGTSLTEEIENLRSPQ